MGISKAVVEGLELGRPFKEVVKVISISILYHPMRADEKMNTDFIYYGTTELIGIHTKKPLILNGTIKNNEKTSDVTSKDVFPEYYLIYVEKFNDMIEEDIDEWVYFFKHGAIKEDFKSLGILLASKKLDYIMMNEEERRSYDAYLAYLGQECSIIDTAKEEGRKEVIEKGKIEIAKNVLKFGMEVEMVSNLTGLSIEMIYRIKNNE